jgi:hypothetical protein
VSAGSVRLMLHHKLTTLHHPALCSDGTLPCPLRRTSAPLRGRLVRQELLGLELARAPSPHAHGPPALRMPAPQVRQDVHAPHHAQPPRTLPSTWLCQA